jgi:hypothetical protein
MPGQDQLEIISPDGEVSFYSLDRSRGITNIGRHPDNDVVIDTPSVAPFHAVLDHRHRPYEIVVIGDQGDTRLRGEPLSPNVAEHLEHWDALEVDSYVIILTQAGDVVPVQVEEVAPGPSAAPAPTESTAAPPAEVPAAEAATPSPEVAPERRPAPLALPAQVNRTRPADQIDEYIVAKIAEREFEIDVDQTARYEVTVTNGGPLVATFVVQVEGINPDWVDIVYPRDQVGLNLNEEGARGTVLIEITPPRHPSSLAQPYHMAIHVTSPDYGGHRSVLGATLIVNPYYDFAVGDLSPQEQTLPWYKPRGRTTFQINNRGNSTTTFRLEATDNEQACNFEFVLARGAQQGPTRRAPPVDVQLQAGHGLRIPLLITPNHQPLIGLRKRMHPFTVNTTMLEQEQGAWPLQGRVKVRPVIGPFLLFLIFAVFVGVLVAIFNPSIRSFEVEPTEIAAGGEVVVQWEANPFANLRIETDGEEIMPPISESVGQMTRTPPEDTTYTLLSNNFLARLPLLSRLFTLEKTAKVRVEPVKPLIRVFKPDRETLVSGESVTLRWEVANADELTLSINGSPETLLSSELETGSRTLVPEDGTTVYQLTAINRYGDVDDSVTVQVLQPTPTPLPQPHIRSFDVNPKQILAGQSVTLTWSVQNATEVEILGQTYLPEGQTVQTLAEVGAVEYVMTAVYDDGTRREQSVSPPITVIVLERPTPTPEPIPPKIEVFEASYAGTFYRGEPKTVELIWQVTGDTTNIELEGPTIGTVSQLSKDGKQSVVISDDTYFTLKVYYEDELKKSKMIQLAGEDPPPPPPPDPIIDYFELKSTGGEPLQRTQRDGYVEYTVEAGLNAEFTWSARNVPKVTLLRQEVRPNATGLEPIGNFDPESSYLRVLLTESNFVLRAENDAGVRASQEIRVKLRPVTEPPPPYDFAGPASLTNPMTLTWSYEDSSLIVGFRIYKSHPGGLAIQDSQEIEVSKDQRLGLGFYWVDGNVPSNDVKYRICALYLNEFGTPVCTRFSDAEPTYP